MVVLSPLTLLFEAATQLKLAPVGFEVNGILTLPPLQIVAELALVIIGGEHEQIASITAAPQVAPPYPSIITKAH